MRTALAPRAIFRAWSKGSFSPQQPAGEPTPAQAADSRRRRRDPGEGRDRLDVEAARVIEVLRQPEQVEVPRRVAQELGDHDAPGLAVTQQVEPGQFRLGVGGRTEDRLDLPAFDVAEPRMALGREVVAMPPKRPSQAEARGQEEDKAPVSRAQHQGDHRRRHHHAHGGAGVDDAHGRGALLHRKPLRHRPRRRGEAAPFADAEEEPAEGEGANAHRQSVAGAGEGPEQHDDREAPACAEDVHQLAAPDVHEGVSDQERRLQLRELLVRDRDVASDGLDGHGQRLAVEVADRDRQGDEDGDSPAEHGVWPYSTFHSWMPADHFGCMTTSRRRPLVVTGLNETRL